MQLKNLRSFYSWQKFKFGFTLTLQWNSKSKCIPCIEKILWYLRLRAVYMVANILKVIWSQT